MRKVYGMNSCLPRNFDDDSPSFIQRCGFSSTLPWGLVDQRTQFNP